MVTVLLLMADIHWHRPLRRNHPQVDKVDKIDPFDTDDPSQNMLTDSSVPKVLWQIDFSDVNHNSPGCIFLLQRTA